MHGVHCHSKGKMIMNCIQELEKKEQVDLGVLSAWNKYRAEYCQTTLLFGATKYTQKHGTDTVSPYRS